MRMRTFVSLLLVATLSSGSAFAANIELAQNKSSKQKYGLSVGDNPLPSGGGKIAGGIVTMSVGAGVGLLVFFMQLFSYCDENDGSTEDSSCENNPRNMTYFGAALVAAGLGVGIPLTVKGVKERRQWKQWNRDNVKGYALLEPNVGDQMRRDAARFARASSTRRGPTLPLISHDF